MTLMPIWIKKAVLATTVICVANVASAGEFFRDDFNNDDPHTASTDDPFGEVVPNYWQNFSSTSRSYSQPTVTESNGRLHISLPPGVEYGGLLLNSVVTGENANPEAVGLWKYGGNEPLGQDSLKNTVDPRMHFMDDKTTAAMQSRYIKLTGIEATGDSYDYQRGFKVMLFANSQLRQLRSHMSFEFVSDRELRIFSRNGRPNGVRLLTSAFLPQVPSAIEIMVDETDYRISAYYEYPVADGQPAYLRSGMIVYSGEHGIEKDVWIQDMLEGVEAVDVTARGATFGISPFAYDLKTSNLSVDSIKLGEEDYAAGDFGF